MKQLKNKILNKILENFIERKKVKEYRPTRLRKILNRIPVINDILLLKNVKYAEEKDRAMYVCFAFLDIINSLWLLTAFCRYHYLKTTPDLYFGIAFFLISIITSFVLIPDFSNKSYKGKTNKDFEKVGEEALSKEDFSTVIDNCNKKIVGKVIENNKGELSYKNLVELDELLLKEKEHLEQIQIDTIQGIWQKIDRKTMLEQFKGKDSQEIIEEFKKIGLEINNEEDIIREKRFLANLVKENNKETLIV